MLRRSKFISSPSLFLSSIPPYFRASGTRGYGGTAPPFVAIAQINSEIGIENKFTYVPLQFFEIPPSLHVI
jgi:hypothetical protein